MSRIYLASSWRNEHQPAILATLREAGHEVYDFRNPPGGAGFAWREIETDGTRWQDWTPVQYAEAMRHPRAREGFVSDFSAMMWADTCVLLLPSGPSAAIEAGWCKGSGRRLIVHVAGLREPDLMYSMADVITLATADLLEVLARRGASHSDQTIHGVVEPHPNAGAL